MRSCLAVSVPILTAVVVAACSSSSAGTTTSDAGHHDAAEPHDTGAVETGAPHDGGTGSGLPAGECRTATDCGSTSGCLGFALPASCNGSCQDGVQGTMCSTDADCAEAGAGSVCDGPTCNCPHGGAQATPICRPGCASASDCAAGHTCGATHHCAATTCATASDCPSNFDCVSGACAAKSCTSDSDCPGAYCVENAAGWQSMDGTSRSCLPTPGVCTPYTA